jgi:hypothetical protein
VQTVVRLLHDMRMIPGRLGLIFKPAAKRLNAINTLNANEFLNHTGTCCHYYILGEDTTGARPTTRCQGAGWYYGGLLLGYRSTVRHYNLMSQSYGFFAA